MHEPGRAVDVTARIKRTRVVQGLINEYRRAAWGTQKHQLRASVCQFGTAEANLRNILPGIVAYFLGLACPFTVIIVDDGSTRDDTFGAAEELARAYPGHLRAVHHPENNGHGAAPQTGIRAALGTGHGLIGSLAYLFHLRLTLRKERHHGTRRSAAAAAAVTS